MGFFKKEEKNIVDEIMSKSYTRDVSSFPPKEIKVENQNEIREYYLTVNITLSNYEAGKKFLDNIPAILESDKHAEIIEASIKKNVGEYK